MIVTSEKDLRKISEKVDTKEGLDLAFRLEEQLRKSHNGIGLSAPQIGEFKRVVVVRAQSYIHFINPEIINKSEPFIHKNEGCLSFPGKWINTLRYKNVTIKDDLHGETSFSQMASLIAQHECLPNNAEIITENGLKTIKDIVENRYSGKVLSWNDDKKIFEYKKILNYSKKRNKQKKKWVRLKFSTTGPNKNLVCTEDHKVACIESVLRLPRKIQYIEAKNAQGKFLIRHPLKREKNSEHKLFNQQQLEALYGSLFGDMCISSRGEIISSHGEPQKEYALFKSKYFGGVTKKGYSGYRNEWSNIIFYGCVNEQTKRLREIVYTPNKNIDFLLENITPISLAFWYMDDGGLCTRSGCRFHTEGFNLKDNEKIQEMLFKKFKLICKIKEKKVNGATKYYIKLDKKESEKLFSLISEFVPECMRFKLRGDGVQKYDESKLNFQKLPYSCKKIKEIKYLPQKESCLFDLEIEDNHNFIANNSLVHNCDHLDGILFFDRAIPKPYDPCICDSGKKFKFCCYKNLK